SRNGRPGDLAIEIAVLERRVGLGHEELAERGHGRLGGRAGARDLAERRLSEAVDDRHAQIAPINSASRGVDAACPARVGAEWRAALGLEMPGRDSRALQVRLPIARPAILSRPVADPARVR